MIILKTEWKVRVMIKPKVIIITIILSGLLGLSAGTSPSFGQLTGGDELPRQQLTTAKENRVILSAGTISQVEEYLRDYIEREETRAGHKPEELKLALISQKSHGAKIEAIFNVEGKFLLNYIRPEDVPFIKGRIAFLKEYEGFISPEAFVEAKEFIESLKKEFQDYIDHPVESYRQVKIEGEMDKNGNLLPETIKLYDFNEDASPSLFPLPRDFSHIPTPAQVEKNVFEVMIKDALNKMIGSTNRPSSVTVFLNGQKLNPQVSPYIENGRVLISLQDICHDLKVHFTKDSTAQEVTMTKDKNILKLTPGKQKAFVNHQPVNLDVPAKLFQGKIFVPLRFVAEATGFSIKWVNSKKAVLLKTR